MNATRARKIAANFTGNVNFVVQSCSDGLLVRFKDHSHYFVREHCFWSYVYRSAGLPID